MTARAEIDCSAVASAFEAAFGAIADSRMSDIPILNRALSVEAVGFRPVGEMAVGALVTPWFINLVAIGHAASESDPATRALPVTATVEHSLPGGSFPFLVCEEDAIGRFAMCSLFSPVLEFADQDTAVATAEAALAEVFDSGADQSVPEDEAAIAAMWRGETPEVTPTPPPADPAPSRRALLTGRLSDADDRGGAA